MGYDGSGDYFDLFAPGAAWASAASRVHVFKIYGSWIGNYATDDELRRVVAGVASRGLALAVEMGPFLPTEGCGSGVEGFDGTLDYVRRIRDAGGTVQVVAFDEPYAFAHVYDGPNACRWPIERLARGVADFVRELRKIAPGVIVGDIEPMWAGISAAEMGTWLDAYREAAGEPFAFLHLDIDWGRADWPEVLLAAEAAARAREVPIGVIYNGSDAGSDELWRDRAVERIVTYEERWGGDPDHVVFQSWFDHPDRVLPESDPTTFTALINGYFRGRTVLRIDDIELPGPGRLEPSGTLTAKDGRPVPTATVELSGTPLDGAYQTLELSGSVPAGATSAVVGLRVNSEGAGIGPADLTFYEVGYSEGTSSANRVPHPRFDRGLEAWGPWGSGRARAQPSDRGPGQRLRIVVRPDQTLGLNSDPFGVTAGATYHFSVAARVPIESVGSAYIAVIFLRGTEVARHRLSLAPVPVPFGEATTDALGAYRFSVGGLDPGRYSVQVTYPGDASRWPASTERTAIVD